ncbi:RNA polymerase sigma factor [Williamsia sp. CHRR-6]|uniref:RNA polymerase sigma factor n=1 Tax=Williamsia sp. CHRR-6 TaxID=2835871 RepID=UPI001BD97964|nr:RNA polymerase sigma factor [Williamsia sp. CHRR-6]MBT0566678.1 RNA polymerase sigma factor [Williamsia sp. CHRR-6]
MADRPPPVLNQLLVEELYTSTAHRLHNYVARRVGATIADDIVAESFLILWRERAGQPCDADAARAWLFGVATNLVRRHARDEERRLRAGIRDHRAESPPEDDFDRATAELDSRALAGPLRRMLADLPTNQRDVLMLVAWGDLTPSMAAAALSIPEATARSRLHRARNRIKSSLNTYLKDRSHG